MPQRSDRAVVQGFESRRFDDFDCSYSTGLCVEHHTKHSDTLMTLRSLPAGVLGRHRFDTIILPRGAFAMFGNNLLATDGHRTSAFISLNPSFDFGCGAQTGGRLGKN